MSILQYYDGSTPTTHDKLKFIVGAMRARNVAADGSLDLAVQRQVDALIRRVLKQFILDSLPKALASDFAQFCFHSFESSLL